MQSGANRWWEEYLVRYLMPSIAGTAIVNWLCFMTGDEFRSLLLLPATNAELDGPALILLLLYGNLFCYIASFPVLCFHATRVLDFSEEKWPVKIYRDGYILTVGLALATFLISIFLPPTFRYWAAFVVAALFSSVQILRLLQGLQQRVKVYPLSTKVSPIYGYAYTLAKKRGVPEETETTKTLTQESPILGGQVKLNEDEEEIETVKRIRWRPELIETYRHLREHGNSAFIFLLELVLAALAYCVLIGKEQAALQLSALSILFAIWAFPSMFVHLLAQHMERLFSWYDKKLSKR